MEYEKEILSVYEDEEILKYIKSKVNEHDVEDIRQSAICKLLKVKDKSKIRDFKNYYFIVVKSVICDYYKKKIETVEYKDITPGTATDWGEVDLMLLLDKYPHLIQKLKGERLHLEKQRTWEEGVKRERSKLYEDLWGRFREQSGIDRKGLKDMGISVVYERYNDDR